MRLDKLLKGLRHYHHVLIAVGLLCILALLLTRNPFSEHTLIPNFEPFPDSFHYITTARCQLEGQGWRICRSGEAIAVAEQQLRPESWQLDADTFLTGSRPAVPPLYSWIHFPLFFFFEDNRIFYFTNVLLSLGAAAIFLRLVWILTKSALALGAIGFLYVTNYYIYWFPSLAMAENLLLLLFLLLIWSFDWLQQHQWIASSRHLHLLAVLTGLGTTALYATKYAALPLSILFVLAYSWLWWRKGWRYVLSYLLSGGLFFLMLGGYTQVLGVAQTLLMSLGPSMGLTTTTATTTAEPSKNTWYAASFWWPHFQTYLSTVAGQPNRFLWDVGRLLPFWAAFLGWLGLVASFWHKQRIALSTVLIGSIVLQITLLAFFYTTDSRYIYTTLPSLFFGLALTYHHLSQLRLHRFWKEIVTGALVLISGWYAIENASRLRSQLAVNFRYAETPWWLLSTKHYNQYFANLAEENEHAPVPYLITLHNSFYLDMFSNNLYQPLPLSHSQDFRGHKTAVWGIPNQPLLQSYQQLLEAGAEVYVGIYGLTATEVFQNEFKAIEQRFETTAVAPGCFDQCTIYKLTLRDSTLAQ